MRAMTWFGATAMLSGLSVLSLGCAMAPADDEGVSEAREAQIDPGVKGYVLYQLVDAVGILKGKVLVTNTAGGGFSANREYWYMSANLSNSGTYTFVGGTSEDWTSPPSGLGTLSFVTQRTPTWTSGTPSGTFPVYSNSLTGERVGMDWQMTLSHGTWGGSITWWHSNTNNIFGPGTSTTLASGTPPSGTWYSYSTSPL